MQTINSLGQSVHSTEEGQENFANWFGDSKVVTPTGVPLVVYHGTRDAGFHAFDHSKRDTHHVGFFFTSSPDVAETYGSREAVELRNTPPIKTVGDLRRFLDQQQSEFDGRKLLLGESQQILDDETEPPRLYTRHFLFWTGKSGTQEGFQDVGEYYVGSNPAEFKRMIRDAVAALASGPVRDGTYSVYLSIENPLIIDGMHRPWMAMPFEGGDRTISEISAIAMQRGHDGLIVRNAYDSKVILDTASDIFVAFHPEQIKSVLNSGRFDRESASLTDHDPAPQPQAQRRVSCGIGM